MMRSRRLLYTQKIRIYRLTKSQLPLLFYRQKIRACHMTSPSLDELFREAAIIPRAGDRRATDGADFARDT
jgi:hypothetical protein